MSREQESPSSCTVFGPKPRRFPEITDFSVTPLPVHGYADFTIQHSTDQAAGHALYACIS